MVSMDGFKCEGTRLRRLELFNRKLSKPFINETSGKMNYRNQKTQDNMTAWFLLLWFILMILLLT